MNSKSESQRLVELEDIPRPVANSMYLALSVQGGDTHLSYHKKLAADVGVPPDISQIRILNLSDPTACVNLVFDGAVATLIEGWDSADPGSHSLAELGLVGGRVFEVLRSEWIPTLRNHWNHEGLRHFVCAFRVNVVQVAAQSLRYSEGETALESASSTLLRAKSLSPREA